MTIGGAHIPDRRSFDPSQTYVLISGLDAAYALCDTILATLPRLTPQALMLVDVQRECLHILDQLEKPAADFQQVSEQIYNTASLAGVLDELASTAATFALQSVLVHTMCCVHSLLEETA